MSEKKNRYAFMANVANRIFGWEKNRKSRFEYLFVGFLVGMFAALEATVTVFTLTITFSEVSLRVIGGLLGTWALTVFVIWFLITLRFGYKDIQSVIKNSFFKWSALSGILFMIIGMIVLWIFLPTL